jgi:tetratricopeptide (TPR) repeat protein
MLGLRKIFWWMLLGISLSFSYIIPDSLKEAKKAYSGRQYQKAVKLFQEYSKTAPSDGEPYMYLGYIYESLKEYNISTAYFRKASDLKLSSKQKKTVLLKLIIYFNYIHAWNYVVHYSNQYLSLDPGNSEVEKILAKARGNRGSDHIASVNIQYQDRERSPKQDKLKNIDGDSKSQYKEGKQEKKIDSKKITSEESEIWESALKSIEKFDFSSANSSLTKLVELFPENKDYLYKAGIVKMKLKDFDSAIHLFDQALKYTNEKNDLLYYYLYLNKGICLSKLEKYEQALDVLKKSYSYNKSYLPLFIIIRLKSESGDFEDVLRYSKYILNIDPENLEALMNKSIALLQLQNKKEGYKELLIYSKKIKAIYPNYINIPETLHPGLHYLGVFYSGRKKYRLSNKYLSLASKSRITYKSHIFSKGKNHYYLNNHEQAQIELSKLNEIPAANFLLSKIYLASNQIEKTKEYIIRSTAIKSLYWSRILIDPSYKPVLQTKSDLSIFIQNRGNPITLREEKTLSPQNTSEGKTSTEIIKDGSLAPALPTNNPTK